jgi:hypothetical protein
MRPIMMAVIASALMVIIGACTNPAEQVRVTDYRPSLLIKGAPLAAELLVDGLSMGEAAQYAEKALVIENGTHLVQVRKADTIIYSEKIFVSGQSTKTLTLPNGGQP